MLKNETLKIHTRNDMLLTCSASNLAATDESTPPDMATTTAGSVDKMEA